MFAVGSRFLHGWELSGSQCSTEAVPKVQLPDSRQPQRSQVGRGRKMCQEQEGNMPQSDWLLWHSVILLL